MAETIKNTENQEIKNTSLIEEWGKKSPRFEKRYEQSVLRVISDYGVGASENTSAKGKVLGAGYEPYIMAFFIGLYANKRLPLSENTEDLKKLGQPLQFWGNLDSKKFRRAYSDLRSYIFIALVAKTEIDWITLDKGNVDLGDVMRKLIETMEEYANYGFSVMEDKLNEDKAYFFSHRSFLDIFLQLTNKKEPDDVSPEDIEDL